MRYVKHNDLPTYCSRVTWAVNIPNWAANVGASAERGLRGTRGRHTASVSLKFFNTAERISEHFPGGSL
jgi:hypothetical protein